MLNNLLKVFCQVFIVIDGDDDGNNLGPCCLQPLHITAEWKLNCQRAFENCSSTWQQCRRCGCLPQEALESSLADTIETLRLGCKRQKGVLPSMSNQLLTLPTLLKLPTLLTFLTQLQTPSCIALIRELSHNGL